MNIAKTLDLKKTARFEDKWDGEAYWFEAKTNALTPKLMQRFADMQTHPIEIANGLADLLTDWSIDMDGADFPPTVENLSILPVDFLTRIIEKVGESWQGNEQKPKPSRNGSAASAK